MVAKSTSVDRGQPTKPQLKAMTHPLSRSATDESACTPGSVTHHWAGGHPSRPAVAGRLQRPTRRHRTGRPRSPARSTTRGRYSFLALLRVGFTEPPRSPGTLVGSYPTVSPLPHNPAGAGHRGGLFSVALSRGLPRVAVSNHPALWSPDVPRRADQGPARRGRPANSSIARSIVPETNGQARTASR